jgi:hypothetical protein
MKKPEWPGIVTAVGVLLILTLVLVGARDDFHLKEWQPLMASVIALGGAAVVYRGATLAYKAAMAKVDLDRDIHAREAARVTLGVCLRLEFSLRELSYDVSEQLKKIPEYDTQRATAVSITIFDLTMQSKLDEAWANLDRLPRQLSQTISEIRATYFDYQTMVRINPNAVWTYGKFTAQPPEIIQLKRILQTLEIHCGKALEMTRAVASSESA